MTAKLVKARVKAVEEFPDWAKCCPEAIEAALSWGIITIDLSTAQKFAANRWYCHYCRAEYPELIGVADVADGLMVEMELLDIDETGVPNGNYAAGPTA